MRNLLIIFTSFFLGSSAALACDGNPKCTDSACHAKKTAPDETGETPAAEVSGTEVVIKVAGMTCGGCSDKITKTLTDTDGVSSASVCFKSGKATIQYDDKSTTPDQLVQVITSSGFKASLPE